MKATLAVLADHTSITQDGKLNINGIFHEINPPFLPFPLPQMFLVASFETEPEEHGKHLPIRVTLRRANSDGPDMVTVEGEVQVGQPNSPGSLVYLNQVVGLSGIIFDRAGDYEFSISVQGVEKATVPLRVNEVGHALEGGVDG